MKNAVSNKSCIFAGSPKKVQDKIRLLKNIKPNPDWLQSQRSVLFLQIKESGKSAKSVWHLPVFVLPQFSLKTVLIGLLILYLISGSGFSILQASSNSLPGDLLYPVKITLENVRLKIASQEIESRLQLEFVANRVNELNRIVNQDEDATVKSDKVIEAVDKLTTQVKSTKNNLSGIKTVEPQKIMKTAEAIGAQAVQSEKALLDAKEKLVSELEGDASKEVVQAIDAAVKEIKETSTLAAEFSAGKAGTEVLMEVKEGELPEEIFPSINEASTSFEDIK